MVNLRRSTAAAAAVLAAIVLSGCHAEQRASSPEDGHFVLEGGTVAGSSAADIEIRDGRIVAIGRVSPDARRVSVRGRFIAPALIDSHVHLAYLPAAGELAAGGVAAVVDLAAPLDTLNEGSLPLARLAAGPMLTAPSGYPTESWGRDGYGLELEGASNARIAVRDLERRGARVVKLAVTEPPALDDDTLRVRSA
jgi:hypothetical protein